MTSKSFSISCLGEDQPGIIAAITKVLFEQECNLADTAMSLLNGHFTMVLIARSSVARSVERLSEDLSFVAKKFDLTISVQEVSDSVSTKVIGKECVAISVYGADRPGIVHALTSVIAELKSNIVDLRTQGGNRGGHLYALIMEVELAQGCSSEQLRERLSSVARSLDVQVTLQDRQIIEL